MSEKHGRASLSVDLRDDTERQLLATITEEYKDFLVETGLDLLRNKKAANELAIRSIIHLLRNTPKIHASSGAPPIKKITGKAFISPDYLSHTIARIIIGSPRLFNRWKEIRTKTGTAC